MSRRFEVVRENYPGIIAVEGEYFEEGYDNEHNETVWRLVREEYVAHVLQRDVPSLFGTNPDTCKHRVLYPVVDGSARLILCIDCASTISPEYWLEHLYDYDNERGVWVERPGGGGVERAQARGDSEH